MAELGFPQQLHAIGLDAIQEAARRGSSTVEAEHVLLALAAERGTTASRTLVSAGLDYDAIDAALLNERTRSLAAAGIVAPVAMTSTARQARPTWGASVRELIRATKEHLGTQRKGKDLRVELVRGILAAELGTVPRALAYSNIDRVAVADALPAGS